MKEYKLKNPATYKRYNYVIEYEKELNSAQYEAVKMLQGPVLVIAGAGTGKTKTLIYRVARLVEENIKPENILLLTFTRKAAENMLKRASALLDERCGKVAGGTFHSFCNMVLRKYSKLVGFQENFTILDESDAESVIGLIRARQGFNRKEKRFPLKSTIAEVISKSINKNIEIEDVLKLDYPHFVQWVQEIKIIQLEYRDYKKEKQIMDYDDLLLYVEKLLKENDGIRKKISSYYKYLMVDEFQDTNRIQANIAYLLASEHKNIMVVGDDSQSIYSFRGADFRNIMDFPKKFPECRIITLEQNYRSSQPILDLTNALIENSIEKYSKSLFTKKESICKPVYIETKNPNIQSRFIVQRILELREEGVKLGDIAVLFRNAWHSDDLEIELNAADIPFVKYGGIKFAEAAHIKDMISYLKVFYNPLDSISWFRVLLLLEGIGEKSAADIISKIQDSNKGFESLKDFVFDNAYIKGKSLKQYELHKLFKMFESLQVKNLQPYEQLKIIFDYYYPIFKNKYDDFNKREKDIESLFYIAQRYKKISDFLSDFTIEPIRDSQIAALSENSDEEKLTLSTIHSAKGLEWHTVFVIYLVDGYIPSTMSMENIDELEEERRLLYVALTRAKENLYLVKPNNSMRGGNYFEVSHSSFSELSRFLKEKDILEKYTEKWVITGD